MKKTFYVLIGLLPLFLTGQKMEKSSELIVMIEGNNRDINAAGIVVGRTKSELLVLAADHSFKTVTDMSTEFSFLFKNIEDSIRLKGRLEKRFEDDLAILKVQVPERLQKRFCTLSFNQMGDISILKKESRVSAIGYGNMEKWSESKRNDDVISSINERFISFKSLDIVNGFSGGGLINEQGHLIGMILETNPPKALRLDSLLSRIASLGYNIDLNYNLPNGMTRLHDAVQNNNNSLVKEYIEDCPEVNIADDYGATALHYATDVNADFTLSSLLKAGFDPKIKDKKGEYPIHRAIGNKNLKAVKKLFELNRTFYLDSTNSYSLMQKAIKADYNIAEFLRQQGISLAFPEGKDTMLINAVNEKNLGMVKTLLRYGADPNQRNLYIGYGYSHNLVNSAISQDTPLIAEALIESGADLTSGEDSYITISWAINKEYVKIIRAWLKAGNDPFIIAYSPFFGDNYLPITFQIYLSNYNPKIVKEFEAMGYNINYSDAKGDTLAHFIIQYWYDGPTLQMRPQLYLERFLKLGGDLTIKNKEGKTPLDYAGHDEQRKEIQEVIQKVKN